MALQFEAKITLRRLGNAALAGVMGLAGLASCATDHESNEPGPPKIERALLVEFHRNPDGTSANQFIGDATNPDNWNRGQSKDPMAKDSSGNAFIKVPDLLEPATFMQSAHPMESRLWPTTQIRLVFNEPLEGSSVEEPFRGAMNGLRAGVVTISAVLGDMSLAPATSVTSPATQSYYQPSGTLNGAPPGPALVVSPLAGWPPSATITISVKASMVKDTSGEAMAADFVKTFQTLPLQYVGSSIDGMEPVGLATLANGIGLSFNSALDPASLTNAAFELRRADGSAIAVTLAADEMGNVLNPPTVVPEMDAVKGGEALTLIVKTTLRDTYGIAVAAADPSDPTVAAAIQFTTESAPAMP